MFTTGTVQAQAQAEREQEKLTLGDRVRLVCPIDTVDIRRDAGTMATVMQIVTNDKIIVKIDGGEKFTCTANMWKQAM